MEKKYDIIVIGSGPAGIAAAKTAAKMGGKVALVEKDELGGTCLNTGCIPTKTLIHKAKIFKETNKLIGRGLFEGIVKPNWEKMIADVKIVVETNKKGIISVLKNFDIDVIFGRGEILYDRTVIVGKSDGGDVVLNYEKGVVVATGSAPKKISNFFQLEGAVVFYSDDVFDITKFKELPKKLLIIGGGVIGCEFATLFENLGVEVIIVEAMKSILPGVLDEDFSASVIRGWKMRRRNINIITGEKVVAIDKNSYDIECKLSNGNAVKTEKVLVTIGRSMPGFSFLRDKNETSDIIVVGDAAGRQGLAYTAEREGEKAAFGLMGDKMYGTIFPVMHKFIPYVVFTDPEIATVGMTELEANNKKIEYRIAKYAYRAMGRSHCDNEMVGEVKMLVDLNDKVIGVQLFGAYATELIQVANVLMHNLLSYRDWLEVLWPHPVYAEIFKEALKKL